MNLINEVKRARKVHVPFISVTTTDQPNLVAEIKKTYINDLIPEKDQIPLYSWDILRGYVPYNSLADMELKKILDKKNLPANQLMVPATAINFVADLPKYSLVVFYNAHKFLDNPMSIQALMNIRKQLTGVLRTAIFIGPNFTLPPEISQDFLFLNEELPTSTEIKGIITKLYTESKIEYDDIVIDQACDALKGLAKFPIEQAAALSIKLEDKKNIISLNDLWERKRSMIRQVRGLSMELPSDKFDCIGGLKEIKKFFHQYMSGPDRPTTICMIDEIEKALAGSNSSFGDSTGVSQDALLTLLTAMEDNKYVGSIFVGPPGCAKTYMARAIASTFDLPFIKIDLGGAQGPHVGESQQYIRSMMSAVNAIAGIGGAFVIPTSNGISNLPPELKRRFPYGPYFFALPDEEERKIIGEIQCKVFGVPVSDFFNDKEGWSGANIRDCARLSRALRVSLDEASTHIVSAKAQDPRSIENLYDIANGAFLSASYPGAFKKPLHHEKDENLERSLDLSD